MRQDAFRKHGHHVADPFDGARRPEALADPAETADVAEQHGDFPILPLQQLRRRVVGGHRDGDRWPDCSSGPWGVGERCGRILDPEPRELRRRGASAIELCLESQLELVAGTRRGHLRNPPEAAPRAAGLLQGLVGIEPGHPVGHHRLRFPRYEEAQGADPCLRTETPAAHEDSGAPADVELARKLALKLHPQRRRRHARLSVLDPAGRLR